MIAFFGFVTIGVVTGYLIAYCTRGTSRIDKVNAIMLGAVIGMVLGVVISFWAGGYFVKKEIVVEKYFISPMFFDGKPIVALVEEHDSLTVESDNYVFQIKEGDKTKSIKHYLHKSDIFFTPNDGEERRLEVKRSRTCRKNMWIWFFYSGTGIVKSEATFREGDNFLTLPRHYSL